MSKYIITLWGGDAEKVIWVRRRSKRRVTLLLLLLLLSRFSHVQLCDPIDGSPPGSPFPGILQARTLEWVAISFSNARRWKVKVKSLSRVWPSATPWTAAYQAPLSMGFSRQEYWSGVPSPSLIKPYMFFIIFKKSILKTPIPCLKYFKISHQKIRINVDLVYH